MPPLGCSSCTTATRGSGNTRFRVNREAPQPLSLSQLEARSGYSRRALQRAFQQRFGCGPMQWLHRRRLELALERRSCAGATNSVSAIARRCGYLCLARFSRDFSRVYGRGPSEILRANEQPPAPSTARLARSGQREPEEQSCQKRQKLAHIAKRVASARKRANAAMA